MNVQLYREIDDWRPDAPLEPLDIVAKETAHDLGLLHLSVHLLVTNRTDGVWCRVRGQHEVRYAGLSTTTFGVHVPAGSTAELELRNSLPLLGVQRVGQFRVRDGIENEVCELFTWQCDNLPAAAGFSGHYVSIPWSGLTTSPTNATPHLLASVTLLAKWMGSSVYGETVS